jgi:hypothetical protein
VVGDLFRGTLEQQDARLKELRQDPRFRVPFHESEIPIYHEGGADCEDALRRIQEKKRRNQKNTQPKAPSDHDSSLLANVR